MGLYNYVEDSPYYLLQIIYPIIYELIHLISVVLFSISYFKFKLY